MVSLRSGRSSRLAASPPVRVEGYCASAGGLNGRKEEGVEWLRAAGAAGGGTPEQANAADREDSGFHASARRAVTLCPRRLIAGVRRLLVNHGSEKVVHFSVIVVYYSRPSSCSVRLFFKGDINHEKF